MMLSYHIFTGCIIRIRYSSQTLYQLVVMCIKPIFLVPTGQVYPGNFILITKQKNGITFEGFEKVLCLLYYGCVQEK